MRIIKPSFFSVLLLAMLVVWQAPAVDSPLTDTQAAVTIDTGARSIPYSPMIFGGFLEHFDHQVYGGFFEPGSPLSDKKGFRRDVIDALKELKVPVVRWPGGCYVSGYHWEAGVGKERKPTDDMAWGVIEQWSPFVLEAAKAMKAADPRIQLTATALPNREWTLPLLKEAGQYLDYISIHSYWLPLCNNHEMPDYLTCIMHSEGPEKTKVAFANGVAKLPPHSLTIIHVSMKQDGTPFNAEEVALFRKLTER